VYRTTKDSQLSEVREVGSAKLPSTVQGVLAHIGDHTQRHAGQVITTAKIVRKMSSDAERGSDR
jgi:hypothetical protein